MAAKTANRARSERARGLRTLQHQTLSPAIRAAIDTVVWLRALVLAAQPGTGREPRWATKDQVHDEALTWFLDRYAEQPLEAFPARRVADEDVTFWIDSKLMERARRMATRDGVKVARLMDAALGAYVRERIPSEWLAFRERVQLEAVRLCDTGVDKPAPRPLREARATRTNPREKKS